ncbi:hypothetical protein N0V93_004708 [Gnomoniopsis smithogilvyi]|uniref:Uncharacterized protein n=1 Tax=Gnomoniopsis smithogilvyi TaxID=1191159 RepID=A0A9W8YSX0_9PEZI|nr:hypothetical protein N0V93_004708 [Gnomoniopsis smithogilvyi]
MRPEFRFDGIDLVINRNSLRYLLDFSLGRSVKSSFRINMFLIKDTLIVERCIRKAAEMIRIPDNRGFGHNFEHTFTAPSAGLGDSSSHHRVLRYKLGQLNCVVRFEVDACYHGGSEDLNKMSSSEESTAMRDDTIQADTNMAMTATALDFGLLSLQDDKGSRHSNTSRNGLASSLDSVTVIPRGAGTAQELTAELKTRSKHLSLSQNLPQLWFGRTPFLISGSHTKGSFHKVDVLNVDSRFEDWEKGETIQKGLQKMVSLLSELREITRRTKGGACVAVYEQSVKPHVLRFFELKQKKVPLPEHLIKEFWSDSTG